METEAVRNMSVYTHFLEAAFYFYSGKDMLIIGASLI